MTSAAAAASPARWSRRGTPVAVARPGIIAQSPLAILADHKHDRRAWVFAALGIALNQPEAERYAWERARPDDRDVLPLAHRLLRAVGERVRWRRALDDAKAKAAGQTAA